MTRALAEIGAIVQKAALGAGIPLGQAEDLGRLAFFVAGTEEDLSVIAQALDAPQTPVDVRWDRDELHVLSGPVALIAPIVRDAFAMGLSRVKLADADYRPLVAVVLKQAGVGVCVTGTTIARNGVIIPAVPRGPVQVPEQIWAVFEGFAAKTYVPQTDASRAAGAGAGLTDND